MTQLLHSKEHKIRERPSCRAETMFQNIFRKKEAMFEFILPDKRSRMVVSGKTALEGIINAGEKIAEGVYRIKTEEGKDAILHTKTGEDGRAYIDAIEIDGKKYDNIQFYIDGGFARSEDGVFLGLDQIAPKEGKLVIILQDDSKFLGIKDDIVVESGEIYDPDRKKISFLSHGDGEAPENNDNQYSRWKTWYGEWMKNDKLAKDKELLVEQFKYLGELKVDTTIRLQKIESEQREVVILRKERESEKQNKERIASVGFYREHGKTNGEGILLVNYSEYDGVRKKEVNTRFDVIRISEEENMILRCIMDPTFRKLYGRMYGFGEIEEIEDSNPRVQRTKIDAPVDNVVQFRVPEAKGEIGTEGISKVDISVGAKREEGDMILFRPPRESEGTRETGFRDKKDSYQGERDTRDSKKEQGNTKEEPKKDSGKVIDFESEREKRMEKSKESGAKKEVDEPKKKFESKKEKPAEKKTPNKEEKKSEGKKEDPKKKELPKFGQEKSEKTRTERAVERIQRTFEVPKQLFAKVEQFLAKELKLSKEKVQRIIGQFKIAMQKLESEIKQEVKQFIVFVKELFKFEKIKNYLKEKIENNFILNYTKIKLQKIMAKVEQKVENLKVQIKESFERIKIRLVGVFEKIKTLVKRIVEPIKPIIPIQKYEAIRKRIAHLILVYLILRIFSLGKRERK